MKTFGKTVMVALAAMAAANDQGLRGDELSASDGGISAARALADEAPNRGGKGSGGGGGKDSGGEGKGSSDGGKDSDGSLYIYNGVLFLC